MGSDTNMTRAARSENYRFNLRQSNRFLQLKIVPGHARI